MPARGGYCPLDLPLLPHVGYRPSPGPLPNWRLRRARGGWQPPGQAQEIAGSGGTPRCEVQAGHFDNKR
eukprot:4413108-Alexandrium_andersonii.AAC.1